MEFGIRKRAQEKASFKALFIHLIYDPITDKILRKEAND